MRDIWLEVNITAFKGGNQSLQDILEEYTSGSQFVYHQTENILLIVIYVPVFLIALLANILVITIFIKYRSFRTVTNCFLMNLSVADLLVTIICMPAQIFQAVHTAWLFGEAVCKLNHYLQAVSVGSSVFTLTAMSIDRYLAIRHPLKRKIFISKRLIIKVICCIWIISLTIFAPILWVRKTDGFRIYTYNFVYCMEQWNNPDNQRLFGLVIFVMVYALPGLTIAVAYALMGCRLRQTNLLPDLEPVTVTATRTSFQICTMTQINMLKERRKVARTLMVLAVVFAGCWLPSSLLSLILDFSDSAISKPGTTSSDFDNDIYVHMQRYFNLLGHLNSLLNPLLYCLLTSNFRNHVKDCFNASCN